MRSVPHLLTRTLLGAVALGVSSCAGDARQAPAAREATPTARAATKSAGPTAPAALSGPGTERGVILFSPERVAMLRRSIGARTPPARELLAQCDRAARAPIPGGYEGWDWAHALAELVACWKGTDEARYRRAAVGYMTALLDDRRKVGDGAGGDRVVEHDDGYPIRTYAAFAALGYDWLRDAPELDGKTRARALARLATWTAWYRAKGYLRDKPVANHFIGYFAATALAGAATLGDAKTADEELRHARADLYQKLIAPALDKTLAGGAWLEGWQYGDHVGVSLALYADAERAVGGGPDLRALRTWLDALPRHHAAVLLPDGVHAYDGGDWSDKPARLSAGSMWALAATLPASDPARAESLFLARALDPNGRQYPWLAAIADDPEARATDPRRGTPSLFLTGAGLTLARSDWSPNAVFVSFQAGPTVAPDHQHSDQGHFEIVRGADALLVDSGAYGSAATMSHNTLLVDDGGDGLTYPPNQGRWGTATRTSRFVDAGDHVTVRGDIGDAYKPYPGTTKARTVESAVRDLLFVRPGIVAIHDRVELAKPTYGVTWAAHGATAPRIDADASSFRIESGGSRADVTMLVPAHARIETRDEPSPSGKGPWFVNDPAAKPSIRLEVESPRGSRSRAFFAVVRVGPRDGPSRRAIALAGARGVVGAVLPDEPEGARVVAFADDDRVALDAPRGSSAWIAGLEPGAAYAVTAGASHGACALALERGEGARAVRADAAGTIRLALDGCALR